MTIWWLVLILAAIGSVGIAFIWLAVRIGGGGHPVKSAAESYKDAASSDVEHLFDEDFREELRNRGRLHFEKIITDNAMFLQQDLRLTTSQLNEYMQTEITATLKEEVSKHVPAGRFEGQSLPCIATLGVDPRDRQIFVNETSDKLRQSIES